MKKLTKTDLTIVNAGGLELTNIREKMSIDLIDTTRMDITMDSELKFNENIAKIDFSSIQKLRGLFNLLG